MNANTLTSSRGMCSYIRAQQNPSYPWHSALLEEANIRSFPTCLPYGHSMLTPALLRAKGENWNFKMMCKVRGNEGSLPSAHLVEPSNSTKRHIPHQQIQRLCLLAGRIYLCTFPNSCSSLTLLTLPTARTGNWTCFG